MYTEEQLHCRSGFNLVEIRLPKKFDVCIQTENFQDEDADNISSEA